MDFTDVLKTLKESEKLLLSKILDTEDYGEKERCLHLAHEIRDIQEEIVEFDKGARSSSYGFERQTPAVIEEPKEKALSSTQFPVYFFHGNKLYKVGTRRDSSTELYKKTVPIESFRDISSAIVDLARGGDFTIAQLRGRLGNVPEYRLQVTVMALVKSGILQVKGRGRYGGSGNAAITLANCEHQVQKLPDYIDLVD